MKFSKMHGLGNDFMVIDAINQKLSLSKEDIIRLGRRDTGVGFDQCLLVETSADASVDFFYRIFNSDGTEVGQCGNGARCLARFIEQKKLSAKTRLVVATTTTKMALQLEENAQVSVFLPAPNFHPKSIPLEVTHQASHYELPLANGKRQKIHALNVGNPHAVINIASFEDISIDDLGREISQHPWFTEQCNVGFMQIQSPQGMRLRVYERGCGETKACGSGAVAAAVIGRQFYNMEADISVQLLGGLLQVAWQGQTDTIRLTGPAEFVYEGVIEL